MLRLEWERIQRATRFPDRLAEIEAALGHDPFLIQGCFARPVLADRLARSFFSADSRIHADSRRRAAQLRSRVRPAQSMLADAARLSP